MALRAVPLRSAGDELAAGKTGMAPLAALGGASLLKLIQKRGPRVAKDARLRFMMLTFVCVVSALLLGKQRRCRRAAEGKVKRDLTWWEQLRSHPLCAWLVENGCCVGLAMTATMLVPAPRLNSRPSAFMTAIGGSMVLQWGAVGLMNFCSKTWYAHIPAFIGGHRPDWSLLRYCKGFVSCNHPVDLFNSTVLANAIAQLSRGEMQKMFQERTFDPLKFMGKFTVMRLAVDIAFWLGHRALHHPSLYWLHRRHHEHSRPTVATNFNFHPVDLFIEGVIPILMGRIALESVKVPMSRFEANLMSAYVLWHEVGSHCGKPMPCVTYFPPLAPLYQLVLGNVDENNVKHHDIHHARVKGNYSIVVWPDIVMGTRILDHCEKAPEKVPTAA